VIFFLKKIETTTQLCTHILEQVPFSWPTKGVRFKNAGQASACTVAKGKYGRRVVKRSNQVVIKSNLGQGLPSPNHARSCSLSSQMKSSNSKMHKKQNPWEVWEVVHRVLHGREDLSTFLGVY